MRGKARLEANRRGYTARDCFNYLVSKFSGTPYVKNELQTAFIELKQSDRRLIQRNLKKMNYYSSTIDGLFGRKTEEGLRKFNKQKFAGKDLNSYRNVVLLFERIMTLKTNVDKNNSVLAGKSNSTNTVTPSKNCENTPDLCTVAQLCQKASTSKNGKKVWRQTTYAHKYVELAKKTGLTCNILAEPSDTKIFRVASGTGFFVSKSGHIITNEHVINGCSDIKVHFKNEAMPSKIIAADRLNDLALLRVKKSPEVVFELSPENPYLLQDVIAAGYPFGNKISNSIKVTRGVVSSLSGIGNNYSEIQIDAALQPGNSGGPLIDENGNVVGVAVSKLDAEYALEKFGSLPENTNFGIKVSAVKSLLEAHEVQFLSGDNQKLPNSRLGKLANEGTVFLSCWMTKAQIKTMRKKKAMFSEIDLN